MTEITADLASEFQAPDRITAMVRTADALTAEEIDARAATLTRAEDAYAHLASFQRGDKVKIGGRGWCQFSTVTVAQQHDWSDINRTHLAVAGCCWIDIHVTVGDLLAGKYTIASEADAAAGNVRRFDEAGYSAQDTEG